MKKFLVVDDNQINLDLLVAILKINYSEYGVELALNGEVAIQKALKFNPELILLDILMPGLNGYEVCEVLKAKSETKHIPIIMVSALGQESSERTKGLNVGADAFISKPFNQGELRAQINVALRIRRVEDLLRSRNLNLERNIKEQAIQYSQKEERFLQISEHALEFFWETDENDIFTYVSPVIEKVYKMSTIDIIGKLKFRKLFQLEKNQNSQIVGLGVSFHNIELAIKIETITIWLSMSGFPVKDDFGETKGFRGVCYDVTKRKKAEIALNENLEKIKIYQNKLKKLNLEITLIEENERRRIAENLHDSLGQTLSWAYLNLSSTIDLSDHLNVTETINETLNILRKAIDESRKLTYDLSPPILYELGLVPALKWKLEQLQDANSIETQIKNDTPDVELKKEINIILYRVVCELFTNIIKHAKATKITVNTWFDNENCKIEVCDDGIGFNTTKKIAVTQMGGYGLMSISERIDSINGTFEIISEKGNGSIAQIIVPLGQF